MVGKEPKSKKPEAGIVPDGSSQDSDSFVLPSAPGLSHLPDLESPKVDILNVAQGDQPTSPPPVPGGGKLPTDLEE